MRIVYLFLVVCCHYASSTGCRDNSQPWKPDWSDIEREHLQCQTSSCEKPIDECCPCNSCMSWEGMEKDMEIEYISVLGKSLAVFEAEFNQSDVYRLEHTHSDITEIPSNVCNWDQDGYTSIFTDIYQSMSAFWGNLVELNFTGNKIRRIPDINCLERLDNLDLSDNRIIHVSNSSFQNLSRLRSLNLDRNQIKDLDINIFSSPRLNLFHLYMTRNILEKLDVSNMLSLKPFCLLDFADNKITEIVRENFVLDLSKTYGPGFMSISGNLIKEFPNFKELLQLDSWEQLGKLITFGFDLMDIPLKCDCNLEPYFKRASPYVPIFMNYFMKVKCTSPPEFDGIPVIDLKPYQLICNVSQSHGCTTPECTCVDKPSDDTLYINCANSDLKQMPTIPSSSHSKFISLNVSGNNIQTIGNESYLSRLNSFDISHNDLRDISNDVIKLLENCTMLDISDNPKLTDLPRRIQYRQVGSTRMNNLVVHCGCDTLWIETWLKQNGNTSDSMFECKIPDIGIRLATEFKESDLDCNDETDTIIIASMLSSGILLMILVGFTVYSFKYELLILYLRLRRRKTNTVMPSISHDVYISFNENEDHVREWVNKCLNPYLLSSGYSTFIALRDIDFGSERNSEVISAIQNSRHFLIVLSESYLCKAYDGMRSWTENEWKYGWYNFRASPYKTIVLVNFDHMAPSDVEHPAIKAYLRVGYTVNFKNQDRGIMGNIEEKLGQPTVLPNIDTRVNENKKTKFSSHDLFIACPYQISADMEYVDFDGISQFDEEDDEFVNFAFS